MSGSSGLIAWHGTLDQTSDASTSLEPRSFTSVLPSDPRARRRSRATSAAREFLEAEAHDRAHPARDRRERRAVRVAAALFPAVEAGERPESLEVAAHR